MNAGHSCFQTGGWQVNFRGFQPCSLALIIVSIAAAPHANSYQLSVKLPPTKRDQRQAKSKSDDAANFTMRVVVTPDKVILGRTTLYELDKLTGKVLSSFSLSSAVCSDPIVIDGTVYFATIDGTVGSVKNGKELWKLSLARGSRDTSGDDTFWQASGPYLCISMPNCVACIQRATGKLLWTLNVTGRFHISDRRMFLSAASHGIWAVDLESGRIIWKAEKGFADSNGPMLVYENALYVSNDSDEVLKLNASSGRVIWSRQGGKIAWKPIIVMPPRQIVARDADSVLNIFDSETGKLFKYAPADQPPVVVTDQNSTISSSVSQFSYEQGVLYAGGIGGSAVGFMSAFDPVTDSQKWCTDIHEDSIDIAVPSPDTEPVRYGDQLIFQLDSGQVYSLNAGNGKASWKNSTNRIWRGEGPDLHAKIFLCNNIVIVFDLGGITALDASSGKKLWTIDFEDSIAAIPVQENNRLYVASVDGTAYGIDISAGKIVWSFAADHATNPPAAVVHHEGERTETFSADSWIKAKNKLNWSRANQMEKFFKQYRTQLLEQKLTRSKILSLLGTPEISYEYPRLTASGNTRSTNSNAASETTDCYRILENGGKLQISYDASDIVSNFSQSDEPVIFEGFAGTHSLVGATRATVENARKACSCKTISAVEKLLGEPDKSEVNVAPKFPTPIRLSSYWWNLSADGRKVFWVRTEGNANDDLAKRPIELGCIITLGEDCPIKR